MGQPYPYTLPMCTMKLGIGWIGSTSIEAGSPCDLHLMCRWIRGGDPGITADRSLGLDPSDPPSP